MKFFNILCLATSALFLFLFYQCNFQPEAFTIDLGLEGSETVNILLRRASVFMLGFSVLMMGVRNLPHSIGRQAICLAITVTFTGLACLGTYELVRGTVNSSILVAIIIESVLGSSFGTFFFINLKKKILIAI